MLFMSVKKQTIHTIKPKIAVMLELYFSYTQLVITPT